MKDLIKLRDEAAMHRERYETYKNSQDVWLRRKVTCELDRFLMEHRESAIILMSEGLEEATRHLSKHKAAATRQSWWRRVTTRP